MSLNKTPANQCNQHNLSNQCKPFEKISQYYYHGDHLGSSNYVTDYQGQQYEHIEYCPYGETWVEESNDTLKQLNFKFTSKELDEETGLYYFGARYLDPQTSRWMSADPALGSYLPVAGGDNNKLPAGGVYNPINLNLYNYTGNNPLSYKDPDGKIPIPIYAILLDKLFGKSGRQNKTNAPINRSLIKQEDYPSQLGIYCGTVSEYNGAQIIGLIHNKSNQQIVDILHDLGKSGYFSALSVGERIYGSNSIDYKGDDSSKLTSINVDGKLKDLGNDSFAILQFRQDDYYGAEQNGTYHWITYAKGEYIDSNNGKRSKNLSDLTKTDLSKLQVGYIYDKHKNK